MPRGDGRTNYGPKKGSSYRRELTFAPGELEQIKREARSIPQAKRLKTQIAEYATLVGQLAIQYQPARREDGTPLKDANGRLIWPDDAFDRFDRLMTLFGYLAGKGAPFQDPTFKAIALHVDVPQQQGDEAKVINLKIFENTGTAVGLMEAMGEQADVPEMDDGRRGGPDDS